MNPILNQNIFFVKEHVGMFKAANNYDVYNPETQEIMITCREEGLGFFTKMFRFTDYKRMTPFNVVLKDSQGNKVLTVKRGLTLFVSTVEVLNEKDELVGTFKQKFFSFGGKFTLFDKNDKPLCILKGKWTSWDFRFVKDDVEFARVTKKWSGFGKELFTSADNYILQIENTVPENHPLRTMIVASVMCIDMVLKE
jgi:uncharacterized protein YxjI